MQQRNDSIVAYLAFHSFGNKIVYPWGHTGQKIEDWKDLHILAEAAADAIENAREEDEQRSWDWSQIFYPEPTVSQYAVSQQSLRDVPLTTIGSIRQSIRRVFIRDNFQFNQEVREGLKRNKFCRKFTEKNQSVPKLKLG